MFTNSKYPKAPKEFDVCSVMDKQWICKTCDCALRRGKLPAQAKANNLMLENVPEQLSDLNSLEVHLISLRIPFMKMVALPCGKQRAIHGPAVNLPTDLKPACTLLPRLPSQTRIIPMKLKRKLSYKGHYMYQYIQPGKVLAALQWLKMNNPLYKDVEINSDCLSNAAQDDPDLWEALIAQQHPPLPSTSIRPQLMDRNISIHIFNKLLNINPANICSCTAISSVQVYIPLCNYMNFLSV